MSIKIGFADFWPGFEYKKYFIYKILQNNFDIEVSRNPDYLLYSDYSNEHLQYDCIKVRYSAENVRPNFSISDYVIGFDYSSSPRYLRLPLYVAYFNELYTLDKLLREKTESELDRIIQSKNKFCCFVVSNPDSTRRIDFFHKLSKYKLVDSGGSVLNNVGGRIKDKLEFVKQYKFIIAFENSSYPGYTTEKILQPFHVNTIPIYWGNPVIHEEFNTKSFINWHEYNSDEKVIEEIIRVDNDNEMYRQYLSTGMFYENEKSIYFSEEKVINYFERVFKQTQTNVRKVDIQKERAELKVKQIAYKMNNRFRKYLYKN